MDQLSNEIQQAGQKAMDLLPQLLSALALIIAAWVVAKIVSWLVTKAVGATGLGKSTSGTKNDLGQSLGTAGFWLTILFFLPPILTRIGMTESLGPVQNMIDGILTYTPRILGAAVILGIGWLVASIVRQAIESLINAAPVDSVAERAGFGDVVKGSAIASAAGVIVFVLILIPVGIAALDALSIEAVTGPLTAMLEDILITIPNIFVAAIILVVAFLIGRLVKGLLMSVLTAFGFDNVWNSLGFATSAEAMDNIDDKSQQTAPAPGGVSASAIVANIAMLAIIFFGIIEAVAILNFASVNIILNKLLAIVGRVMMGAIVIFAGIFIARFVANLLRQGGGAQSGAGGDHRPIWHHYPGYRDGSQGDGAW